MSLLKKETNLAQKYQNHKLFSINIHYSKFNIGPTEKKDSIPLSAYAEECK